MRDDFGTYFSRTIDLMIVLIEKYPQSLLSGLEGRECTGCEFNTVPGSLDVGVAENGFEICQIIKGLKTGNFYSPVRLS